MTLSTHQKRKTKYIFTHAYKDNPSQTVRRVIDDAQRQDDSGRRVRSLPTPLSMNRGLLYNI